MLGVELVVFSYENVLNVFYVSFILGRGGIVGKVLIWEMGDLGLV